MPEHKASISVHHRYGHVFVRMCGVKLVSMMARLEPREAYKIGREICDAAERSGYIAPKNPQTKPQTKLRLALVPEAPCQT